VAFQWVEPRKTTVGDSGPDEAPRHLDGGFRFACHNVGMVAQRLAFL